MQLTIHMSHETSLHNHLAARLITDNGVKFTFQSSQSMKKTKCNKLKQLLYDSLTYSNYTKTNS